MRWVSANAIKPGQYGYDREGHGEDMLPLLPRVAKPWTHDSQRSRAPPTALEIDRYRKRENERERWRREQEEQERQERERLGWHTKPPLPSPIPDRSPRSSISKSRPVSYHDQNASPNPSPNAQHLQYNENGLSRASYQNLPSAIVDMHSDTASRDSRIIGADALDGVTRLGPQGRMSSLPIYTSEIGSRARHVGGGSGNGSVADGTEVESEVDTEDAIDPLPVYPQSRTSTLLPPPSNLSPVQPVSAAGRASGMEGETGPNDAVGIWARANRYLISPDLERRLRSAGYTPDYNPDDMDRNIWRNEYGVSPFELETLKRLFDARYVSYLLYSLVFLSIYLYADHAPYRIELRNQRLSQYPSQPQSQSQSQPPTPNQPRTPNANPSTEAL